MAVTFQFASSSSSSTIVRCVTASLVRNFSSSLVQQHSLNGNSIRVFCHQPGDSCHRLYSSSNCHNASISTVHLVGESGGLYSNNRVLADDSSFVTKIRRNYFPLRKSSSLSLSPETFPSSIISSSFSSDIRFRSSSFFATVKSSTCEKMIQVPKVKLNDGTKMPVFGLGTWAARDNEMIEALSHAIDVGYRHIDTAFFYQNEKEIGQVIKSKIAEGAVKRDDLYVVTKLWNVHHDPTKVEYACKLSLKNLGLDYIDLYLIHFPVGYIYTDDKNLLPKNDAGVLQLSDYDYLDTYKEMEKLVKKGLVKSIGLSNFNSEQTDRILKNCEIKPVTNQVECHPGFNQKKLIEFSKQRDIIITAYCPLARPNMTEKTPVFLFDAKMIDIANKYKKTPSQIALRYLVDIGTVPIPKSANKKRIEENINIFDFKLTDDEVKVIDGFHTGERINPFNLVRAQNHKYFPFYAEF